MCSVRNVPDGICFPFSDHSMLFLLIIRILIVLIRVMRRQQLEHKKYIRDNSRNNRNCMHKNRIETSIEKNFKSSTIDLCSLQKYLCVCVCLCCSKEMHYIIFRESTKLMIFLEIHSFYFKRCYLPPDTSSMNHKHFTIFFGLLSSE